MNLDIIQAAYRALLFRLGTKALVSGLLLIAACSWAGAKTNEAKRAEVKVAGYGWLGDRKMKQMLMTLESSELKRDLLDAGTIEDSALILMAQLRKDGYLRPSVAAEIQLADGHPMRVAWTNSVEPPLPRPMEARTVRFRIRRGVLYHLKTLEFEGLNALSEKSARPYFLETGVLLKLKSTRIYTPERLNRGLAALKEQLLRLGYEEASVTASHLEQNDISGEVHARIAVHEGAKSMVRTVRVETFSGTQPASVRIVQTNHPYSTLWQQDFAQDLKATNYHRGYPDTSVTMSNLNRSARSSNVVDLDLIAEVRTGPQARVGKIEFGGEKRTRVSTMRSRVPLNEGELLDRVKAEEGRSRMARLGIFETVRLRYDREDEQTRDLLYEVKEGRRTEVNLLFGYGSYELLRGGFQIEQNNLFGMAHHAELKAIQSFKASRGDFTYTIPEMIGQDIDIFLNGFGLRREEVSFTRLEYGGGAGVHRFFKPMATDASLRYNYQVLNATDLDPALAAQGVLNPNVGSVILDVRHDRRDNPLYPQRGYKVFATLETASEYLAGDVNFERLELAGSFHQPLGGGRTLSLGLSHGIAASTGGNSEQDLPFNKRFFPGGQNSIRGYQDGEAAPRDAFGRVVGAETYLLGTVEFEQALTPKWSVVVFSDSIGFARQLRQYPLDETLYSVGGGIRWKTVVGPVRLEYGHNLNPRPGDPKGTLHFSLGFPF